MVSVLVSWLKPTHPRSCRAARLVAGAGRRRPGLIALLAPSGSSVMAGSTVFCVCSIFRYLAHSTTIVSTMPRNHCGRGIS